MAVLVRTQPSVDLSQYENEVASAGVPLSINSTGNGTETGGAGILRASITTTLVSAMVVFLLLLGYQRQ